MNRTQRRAMANVKSKTMEEHFKNTAKILDDIDRRLCKLEEMQSAIVEEMEEATDGKIKSSIPGMEPGEASLIKTGDEND